MKGVVWGATSQTANDKLDQIIKDYRLYRIKPKTIRKSKNGYSVEFENGDIWRAIKACESTRGIRTNVSYIDRMISPMFVDEIIKPCTTACPFQAFHYYWPDWESTLKGD